MINLREYKKEDDKRLIELANNKNVSKYLTLRFPYPYTKEDSRWWLETGRKINGEINRAIVSNGEFVGGVGITPQKGWKSHIAEIGYWIGEDYWGNGIATEALKQMTELAKFTKKYHKLFAPVLEPNKASMRVLEKNDYTLEGVFKQEVIRDEMCFDVYSYAKKCF